MCHWIEVTDHEDILQKGLTGTRTESENTPDLWFIEAQIYGILGECINTACPIQCEELPKAQVQVMLY